jgi:hypothetical protein
MKQFRAIYLLLLATLACAYFSPKQIEIIDLHHKIQPKKASTDQELRTFYSVLSVPANVKEDELEKVYKKVSRKWHPDKFVRKDRKERERAERKFETLSLIVSILRDVERRRHYDYYLKNGFPQWDKRKGRYIYKNKSKPNFTLIAGTLLLLATIGHVFMAVLNRKQKNKRVAQILRDVRWKADHMVKQNIDTNKVMELPDGYDVNTNIVDPSQYTVDDRLVTYCGKVFIVKPDSSVLLYNDSSINTEDQQEMNDLVKKIMDSGHYNLYGIEKKPMNRRERRHVEKDKRTASTADDNNEVIEKLVQFKEDDTGLKLTDLLPLKIVIGVWNMTLGKILYVSPSSKAEVKRNTPSEEDILDTPIKVKSDGDKITLSNGKVLHSRKK